MAWWHPDSPSLGLAGDSRVRVADLGAGAAPWSAALLEAFADSAAVVNDLPGVIGSARRELEARGLASRAEFVAHHRVDQPQTAPR